MIIATAAQRISDSLERAPRPFIIVLSVGLIAVVGIVDCLSGPKVSVAVFYMAPIAVAAWWGDRRLALLIATLIPIVWHLAGVMEGKEPMVASIALWNGLVRFALFSFIAMLLSHFRNTADQHAKLSHYDSLTGVRNARSFYAETQEEIARARRYRHPFSVAYIDIDDFKKINDSFGHLTGDKVLKHAAEVMRASCRATDVVARLGGDEFAILLPETPATGAADMLRKLHLRLRRHMQSDTAPVTFSIGLATFESAPDSVADVIHLTDALMYKVKKSGKDNWTHQVWTKQSNQPVLYLPRHRQIDIAR